MCCIRINLVFILMIGTVLTVSMSSNANCFVDIRHERKDLIVLDPELDGLDGSINQRETSQPPEIDNNDHSEAKPIPVPKSARELSKAELKRKQAIASCLAIYHTKYINANVKRPWSIMHALIGYGKDTQILYNGRLHDGTEYLCANGIGDDRRIMFMANGQLRTNVGVGFQGHEGQLLAMLAQTDVPIDQPMTVDGRRLTVDDLVRFEMQTCRAGSELTFKLIGLAHYLDSDTTWKNDLGEDWSIPRLIKEEIKQPINGAACGGTHRLMGLAYAVKKRIEQDKDVDGDWARAQKYTRDYHSYAMQFQQRDGSFSTSFFESNASIADTERRLYSTGHIMEWYVFSLPEEQLNDERIVRGIDAILRIMLSAPNHELEIGPRGHALHALRIYEERVFGKSDYKTLIKENLAGTRQYSNQPPRNGVTNGRPASHHMRQPARGLLRFGR